MIVLINPNSTEAMTQAMTETAQAAAPGVVGWTSQDGPPAIQGRADGAAAVPPMLDLVAKASKDGAKAILIGCFDDTGLAQAREIALCPVIGIGQAGYHMGAMAGRFSVVTTLEVSVPILEENVHAYGLTPHLGRVRASNVPVLEVDHAQNRILQEIKNAEAQDNIQAVVLGCGGMVTLAAEARAATGLSIIDGVRAAALTAAALAYSEMPNT